MFNVKFFQSQIYFLGGAGVSIGDTSVVVEQLVDLYGNPVTMAGYFGVKGWFTVEQGTPNERQQSFTGITNNMDGTWTLTGISTVFIAFSYTETSGFDSDHAGGTSLVFSNNPGLYSTFANKQNSGTIIAPWIFNALANNANPKIDSNSYTFTALDYITKGYADGVNGYLRLDGTNHMLANLDFGNHRGINLSDPVNPLDAVNLETLQAAAIAGGTPATTLAGGLVIIARQSDFDNDLDTRVVGPLTYYNMPTISQVRSVGSQLFTYGESITALDYVFQADGGEFQIFTSDGTNLTNPTLLTTTFYGNPIIFGVNNYLNVKRIDVRLQRSGSVTGSLTVKIFALSGGAPTGAALFTSNPVLASTVTSDGFVEFDFGTPLVGVVGTTFGWVLDTSGIGGVGTLTIAQKAAATNNIGYVSTNAGATYTVPIGGGGNPVMNDHVYYSTEVGKVYRVNLVTPTYAMGPYKGFAKETGVLNDVKAVQLINVLGGFGGLNPAGEIYINPAVIGGITQTAGLTTGRAVGTAVSATSIQIAEMKKRGDQEVIVSSSFTINQDGNLSFFWAVPNNLDEVILTESIPGSSVIVFDSGTSAGGAQLTLPVRAGYNYAFTFGGAGNVSNVAFYPTING